MVKLDRPIQYFSAIAILFFGLTVGSAVHAASSGAAYPDAAPGTNSRPNEPDSNSLGVKFDVEKEVLPNGLTVLYHSDRTIPLVSYHTWFKVGSKDEKTGLTGIAHLFEHMMFKGSKKYSGDQFDLILQSNGATNNAFTTQDYTGYHIDAPSSKLELIMDIESDRMATLKIDKAALDSEREVVKEEKRFRVDDNPMGLLFQAIYATVFHHHPYKSPVIGTMEDLGNVTPEIAQDFHRTYYSPTNAVVVIAGDFDIAEAKRLIAKYYGQIPRQVVTRQTHTPEPNQTAPRSAFIKRDVKGWTFAINYAVPASGTEESYALDLLGVIMGHGPSSRLYKRIVYKEQRATSASASNNTLQDAGLFQVFVTMKPEATEAAAQKQFLSAQRSIYAEMWRPRNILISAAELERARNQIIVSQVDSLKTLHGKAEALASNEILFGDYSRVFSDIEKYLKVTPTQIRNVARKYLSPERSNLVVVRPKGE